MSTNIPVLELRDIDLMPFTMADVDNQYFEWLHDIEVIRYLDTSRHDRSFDALRTYVTNSIENADNYMFKIFVREERKKVGTISLHINTRHNIADFGYLIGEQEFWGTDVALQAQVGLFDFAFGELRMRKLFGGACITNTGSNFNYHRLGFKREGIRRAHWLPGFEGEEPVDIVDYGCLAEEWADRFHKYTQYRVIK